MYIYCITLVSLVAKCRTDSAEMTVCKTKAYRTHPLVLEAEAAGLQFLVTGTGRLSDAQRHPSCAQRPWQPKTITQKTCKQKHVVLSLWRTSSMKNEANAAIARLREDLDVAACRYRGTRVSNGILTRAVAARRSWFLWLWRRHCYLSHRQAATTLRH